MLLVCGLAEPSVRKAGQQLVNDPLERITLELLQGALDGVDRPLTQRETRARRACPLRRSSAR
jgi:hypothetical protein